MTPATVPEIALRLGTTEERVRAMLRDGAFDDIAVAVPSDMHFPVRRANALGETPAGAAVRAIREARRAARAAG